MLISLADDCLLQVALKEAHLTEAVNELTEMEQLIIGIRQLLDEKSKENLALNKEVNDLQTELEITQKQVSPCWPWPAQPSSVPIDAA